MVTIINYEKRQNDDGKEFFVLQLQGDVDVAFSKTTGMPYLTARRSTISSTFDELTCKGLIGRQMPGSIVKVEVDDYEYTIPGANQVVTLDFRYLYSPEENTSMEKAVFELGVAA